MSEREMGACLSTLSTRDTDSYCDRGTRGCIINHSPAAYLHELPREGEHDEMSPLSLGSDALPPRATCRCSRCGITAWSGRLSSNPSALRVYPLPKGWALVPCPDLVADDHLHCAVCLEQAPSSRSIVDVTRRYVEAADSSVSETRYISPDYESTLRELRTILERASTIPPIGLAVLKNPTGVVVAVDEPNFAAIATAILDEAAGALTAPMLDQELREAYEAGGDSAAEQEKLALALQDMLALVGTLERQIWTDGNGLDGDELRRVEEARLALLPHLALQEATPSGDAT